MKYFVSGCFSLGDLFDQLHAVVSILEKFFAVGGEVGATVLRSIGGFLSMFLASCSFFGGLIVFMELQDSTFLMWCVCLAPVQHLKSKVVKFILLCGFLLVINENNSPPTVLLPFFYLEVFLFTVLLFLM